MSVLVTVVGPCGAADLELDDTRPVAEIIGQVAGVLGVSAPVTLRAETGTELPPAQTLAACGVLDGHRLTLLPLADPAPSSPAEDPVLVCYLALDTSDSMAGPALDAVNAELARLWSAARADARLATACRLAVVSFDADARVEVPLTPAAELTRVPRLAATRPATNYEALFRLLHRQVARDLAALRAGGHRPLRPLVVLLTDGRPTRGYWPPAHAALVDVASGNPADIVAFGFGDASEAAVRRVGTAGAYLPERVPVAAEWAAAEDALGAARPVAPAGLVASVLRYVLRALGATAGPGADGAVTPAPTAPGWRSLAALTAGEE